MQHPDVHHTHSEWSEQAVLHVAAAYSNPFRWRARRELANDFRRHMAQSPNVVLHMIELAYGDRPFEVTDPSTYPNDIQVRTAHELFHKENLLNIAVTRFPPSWKYGAIIDADLHFTRHDWALETIHQLQHYDWVQPFSTILDVDGETIRGEGHRPLGGLRPSFAAMYHDNGLQGPKGYSRTGCLQVWDDERTAVPAYGARKGGRAAVPAYGARGGKRLAAERPGDTGAPGGAWAFRRSAFDAVGGLLDKCILGSGDWFMAFGLICEPGHFPFCDQYTLDYASVIGAWQERASRLGRNIGYVDGFITHHFHGRKSDRAYGSRDNILVEHKYSPTTDVFYDWQGVLQLSPGKPRLRDDIRRYFLARNEDLSHEPR